MNIDHLCMGCMQEKPSVHIKCPYCGYDDTVSNNKKGQLPIWTFMRNSYMIGRSIGAGGFGITYMGYDVNLQKKIAIKEFFPDGYAVRGSDGFTVMPNSPANQAFYEREKARYVEEARILASIEEQAGVVKVISYLEENNTAYIIMEFIEGKSMKQYMREKNAALTVNETLEFMKPVVKALAGIHDKGVVHRDISMDNIMITKNGKVKLIDFGAAHDHQSESELRVYKPYYSPAEQLNRNAEIGTYSDIYSLCVCIYTAITGRYPTDASQRFANDMLMKPSQMGVLIDPLTEAVLMKGLEYDPKDRIKNATDLYYFLYVYGKDANASIPGMEKKIHDSSTNVIIEKMKKEQVKEKYRKRNLILLFGILGLGILIMASRVAIRLVVDSKYEMPKSGKDVEKCVEEFYDIVKENHAFQDGYQVEETYELAADEIASLCTESEYRSEKDRNEKIFQFGTDIIATYGLENAGWFALTYSGKFTTDNVYEDACRQLDLMNENLVNAIHLKNCGKLGVALGLAEDGTYYWIFIYSE